MLDELAEQRAGRGAHDDRAQQRRRHETHEHARPGPPPHSLAAEVIARLLQVDLALGVALDEDHALRPDDLVADELHDRVEVRLCGLS